jgi:hypothetical protein
MKRLAIFTFVALVVWQVYGQYRAGAFASFAPPKPAAISAAPPASADFKCDARTVCSQMTSCAEAKYFLKNCPDVDLRPDRMGLPCPLQWCSSPDSP